MLDASQQQQQQSSTAPSAPAFADPATTADVPDKEGGAPPALPPRGGRI
jgi:hypothetical protein